MLHMIQAYIFNIFPSSHQPDLSIQKSCYETCMHLYFPLHICLICRFTYTHITQQSCARIQCIHAFFHVMHAYIHLLPCHMEIMLLGHMHSFNLHHPTSCFHYIPNGSLLSPYACFNSRFWVSSMFSFSSSFLILTFVNVPLCHACYHVSTLLHNS